MKIFVGIVNLLMHTMMLSGEMSNEQLLLVVLEKLMSFFVESILAPIIVEQIKKWFDKNKW